LIAGPPEPKIFGAANTGSYIKQDTVSKASSST
jgi:hypothetical protein